MKRWLGIICLVVTILQCNAVLASEDRAADCALKRYTSIDLQLTPGGLLLIPVEIDGTLVNMFLNTGIAFSVLGADAPDALAIATRAWPASYAEVRVGSAAVKKIATAKSVKIGGLLFGKVEFLVDSAKKIESVGPPIRTVGMLGVSFFSNVDFELDFVNQKLNLYSQDHCPGKVVYWADTFASVPIREGQLGDMYFLMELENKKIQTSLSTATAETILSTDASKALFDFDEKSSGVVTEVDASGRASHYYRAMALTTEGLGVMNAKIALDNRNNSSCGKIAKKIGKDKAAGYTDCFGSYPLRMGMNVIRKMHIYMATKEKVMYFTAADAKAGKNSEPVTATSAEASLSE